MTTAPGLLTPSVGYKPFRYGWAYDLWLAQQQVHWMVEEVNLDTDVTDWAERLDDVERSYLTHIFRYFTQADIEVNDNYMNRFARVFKPTEVLMMLSAFSNMETIHIAAYSSVVETLGFSPDGYSKFMEYGVLRDKHDYMSRFGVENPGDVLRTLAMFGGASEGLQLFASFAMLLNFPRRNLMKGMGQVISWSVRDESLHCEGMTRLFHAFAAETSALTPAVKSDIRDCFAEVCGMEFRFLDLAYEGGEPEGLPRADMEAYIRHVCDWRLEGLGLGPIWGRPANPLPWINSLITGTEHANFFETRATEYSKGASRGTWTEVREAFAKMEAARK